MANDKKHAHVDTVVIDGQTVYIIKDKDVAESLIEMAEDYLFREEALRRLKNKFWMLGLLGGVLVGIAKYWPQIDGAVRHLLTWLGG